MPDHARRATPTAPTVASIFATLAVALLVAGSAVAALVSHAVPTPALRPDAVESDGSVALAFAVFVTPLSLWVLTRLKGQAGFAAGTSIFMVGLVGGLVAWG